MNACRCPEAKVTDVTLRAWRVLQRLCNHSRFNGGRCTPSRYSEIQCKRCGAIWRTKAAYVPQLKDAPADWWKTPVNRSSL